ncbi:succinate dehydrogenase, partial [Streptomyces sp. SID8455]|nr:succinate dehydrogenase [Streptomyces sp. SID8455]
MSSETSSAAAIGDVEGVSLYDVDHPAPVIEPPRKRTSKTPKASRGNFEMYAWLFMRLSGVVLVVLVIGHLLIQLVLDGGVSKIGFA